MSRARWSDSLRDTAARLQAPWITSCASAIPPPRSSPGLQALGADTILVTTDTRNSVKRALPARVRVEFGRLAPVCKYVVPEGYQDSPGQGAGSAWPGFPKETS